MIGDSPLNKNLAVSKHIDPSLLVQFITRLATERGPDLTPLRLVKLLYLADLYYARENSGETLTGWPWAFVHYGPYCAEAMQTIDASVNRKLITARPYESRYDGEEKYVYPVRFGGRSSGEWAANLRYEPAERGRAKMGRRLSAVTRSRLLRDRTHDQRKAGSTARLLPCSRLSIESRSGCLCYRKISCKRRASA